MGIENHLDAPPKSPSPEAAVATAPQTKGDQDKWKAATQTGTSDAQKVMDRMGISDFQLVDNTKAGDKPARKDVSPSAWPIDLPEARVALTHSAEKNLSPADATKFEANMQKFETRAKGDHLSDQEVQATYESVDRLLTSRTGATYVKDRNVLAQQVMDIAADPDKAKTGRTSDTCGPAAIETLLYAKQPSVAANLITESALTGAYKTQDGTKVSADLIPSNESAHPEDPNNRLYASQIFQSVAMNAGLKSSGSNWSYNIEHGDLKPGQHGDYYLDGKGDRQPYNGTYSNNLLQIYGSLTGKNDLTVIDNSLPQKSISFPGGTLRKVDSAADLQQVLSDSQKNGSMSPVIVGVDARNQPFWNDAGLSGANPYSNYGHWSAVHDYKPELNSISYSNEWDGTNHQTSPEDMFRASRKADANLPVMGQEFVHSLNQNRGNYSEAIDALRIRSETGRINQTDLNKLFVRDVEGLAAQRGSHSLDDETVRNNVLEIAKYLQDRGTFHPSTRVQQLLQPYQDQLNDG
jgi:hypothetical protein